MNWFDPSRRHIGGFPMYYWNSQPVGPLSGWSSRPIGDDFVMITFNLMIRPGVASQFHLKVGIPSLPNVINWIISDPENVFKSAGWEYNPGPKLPPKITAESLGL